ncbi:U6 snRNA-associated Sm-like protein LSm2 [Brevipalpus obovatus]|uniref:U6 snRNA-associated Sm-like protein LSm2 n=1 Tax=Brevipalpus obovatus TaxID=246614 RepID=UPI003D9DEC4E
MESGKERAIAAKTLVCFLQTLIGQKARFELKNDHQVIGTITQVDANMNVEVVDVTLRKPIDLRNNQYEEEKSDYMMIKGSRMRYATLPSSSDEIKVVNNIQTRLGEIQSHRQGVVRSSRIERKRK